jgi:hypothetical protein
MVTIVLWNREPIYQSPAVKYFSLNWDGDLTRADFSIDVDPNFATIDIFKGYYIEKIILNGTEVSFTGDRNDVVTFDGKPYLRKGQNIIEIHHNGILPFGIPIQTAGCYAYLVLESTTGSAGGQVILPPTDWFSAIPWWVWVVLVLVLVVVLLR